MLLLILVLLISIPLVSPSYHIPKLGRYHTFLRIGKRHFTEPCINKSLCSLNQQSLYYFLGFFFCLFIISNLKGIPMKCVIYFNRNLCWPQLSQGKSTKEQYSRQYHFNNRKLRDNT
jgi:hypothetical protein